jgi:hypothetical protein
MLLCCVVPIALIAVLGLSGLTRGSLSGIAPYALVLLCPLMMLFMMGGHDHGSQHDHHTESMTDTNTIGGKIEASAAEPTSAQGRCH